MYSGKERPHLIIISNEQPLFSCEYFFSSLLLIIVSVCFIFSVFHNSIFSVHSLCLLAYIAAAADDGSVWLVFHHAFSYVPSTAQRKNNTKSKLKKLCVTMSVYFFYHRMPSLSRLWCCCCWRRCWRGGSVAFREIHCWLFLVVLCITIHLFYVYPVCLFKCHS